MSELYDSMKKAFDVAGESSRADRPQRLVVHNLEMYKAIREKLGPGFGGYALLLTEKLWREICDMESKKDV